MVYIKVTSTAPWCISWQKGPDIYLGKRDLEYIMAIEPRLFMADGHDIWYGKQEHRK